MLSKTIILIAFVVAGVSAQYAPNGPSAESNAAPEPYSYGYETDSHSAAEQRDPSGRVTGFYTVADADGRQRRVEYVADEAGFRAKVQTNEVGTKSENSADVEVLAAPPTREQLVYQAPAVQQQQTVAVQQQAPRVVTQQVAGNQQAARYQYVQQPYGYGYYPSASNGYQYGSGYYNQPSYAYPGYGGYGNGVYGGYGNAVYTGYGTGAYGSYNNHLPSQYYRSVGATTTGAQAVQGSQYVPVNSQYRGYQTVGVPATQGAYYQTVGVQPAQARSASYQGSSNYIVLKKRESEAAQAEVQKKA